MKVAIAQIKSALGDLDSNLNKHADFIEKAIQAKADLVIFPELSLTGYSLKDLTNEVAMRIDDNKLKKLLEASTEIDIVAGLVEETDEFLYYNSAVYFSKAAVTHVHKKLYLPTYGMFEEGRHFARGSSLSSFNTRFGKMGILICEDVWHSICPLLLTLQGSLFILNIANGTARGVEQPGHISSAKTWEKMNAFYAANHSVFYVFANRVGVEDGVLFWGGSEVVDPFGNSIAKATYFDEELITCDLDIEIVKRARVKSPLLRDERIDFCLQELEKIYFQKTQEGRDYE